MIAQPIDVVLLVWFALAALSTAYVAYDSSRTTLDDEQTSLIRVNTAPWAPAVVSLPSMFGHNGCGA